MRRVNGFSLAYFNRLALLRVGVVFSETGVPSDWGFAQLEIDHHLSIIRGVLEVP